MGDNQTVYLTRCPVGNATEIAIQKSWLFDEFHKAGIEIKLLQEAPVEKWRSHFTHELPRQFRDGGNIPPIWARSNGADTRVIGLNFNERKGGIIVRSNSPLQSIGDLKGKRVALPIKQHESIDFKQARALKGIVSALSSQGLTLNDIELVSIHSDDPYIATQREDVYWDSVFLKAGARAGHLKEVNFLLEDRVDAVYLNGSAAERLILGGEGRYIYDFQADPNADQVNIEYPSTVTVSGQLARENPDAVVLYLRILIRAARWGQENYDEVIRIFAKGSWLDDEEAERSARPTSIPLDLVPELSNVAFAALEGEKNFLLANGFIKEDFAVEEWVDYSFLATALSAEES